MATHHHLKTALFCAALACAACDDGGGDGGGDGPAPMADAGPDASVETPDSIESIVAAVDLTRYSADLEVFATGQRTGAADPAWVAARDRCVEVFLAAGMEVTRQPLAPSGENVIGVLPGTTRASEQVIVGAHFDSEFACDGADDNASGVAGVLEAARALGGRRYERSLVFLCLDAEEDAKRGAADYARRARANGDAIQGAFILEMIAFTDSTPGSQRVPTGLVDVFPPVGEALDARGYRGDFLFYAGDDTPEMLGHLQAAAESADLPLIGVQLERLFRESDLTAGLRRSDHDRFWEADYPAIMLTDTANYRNPNYHCSFGEDDIASLDLDFAIKTTTAVVGALAAAAVPAVGAPPEGRMVDPAPVAEAFPLACDPVAGTCEDGQRCGIVYGNGGGQVACMPPAAESLGLDAPCARDEDGRDQCANGLFCTRTGRPVGSERRCRPICRSNADCAPGDVCPRINSEASNCIAACDMNADQCPEGTACSPLDEASGIGFVTICRLTGPAGEGEDCSSDICQAGLSCLGAASIDAGLGCLAWCSVAAPDCGPGRTCQPFRRAGLDPDLGRCMPDDALR